ncbi:MAG: multicopper oxidase domain-containing protein [Chloroflexi bacterium]|nr:multicopper oxidase domain-containing protein [Chloroflexota bacterium]
MASLRRRITSIGLALALLFSLSLATPIGAQGHGGGGGGGGGGGVIDPPPGAAFRDPVAMTNASTIPGIFEGYLEAKIAPVNVNGTVANLYTYNGLYPGPIIKVKRGDMLKLHFTNSLPATTAKNILGFEKNHTNLHTHGLHVSPEEPADAAHLDIAPGQTYNYEYDLSLQPGGCLNFLHGHVHGLTAEQYWGGMLATILVADETPVLQGYETHVMVLKDITLNGNVPQPYTMTSDYMQGKEGNIVMVNGQVNPVLSILPGQIQRWQILNGSNARFYNLSLQGHEFYLVGTDGGLLDKPYRISSLLLSPGERADLLVKASATKGNYKLLSLPYSRRGNMASPQITLLTLSVKSGQPSSAVVPASIDPAATRLSEDPMYPKKTLVLSMGQGRGYINGQDFDVDPYTIMSDVGTYEVWEILNQSGMDHPFHQHVNAAQVLSVTGGDPGYASLYTSIPAWKDVVIVPKWGSVRILVPVMDYTGMTMFHCHILEHEDIGMMGMWHIMGMGEGM